MVSQPPEPESWIPLNEFILNGVRTGKKPAHAGLNTDLPPPPAGWVDVADYLLEGNRPATRAVLAARERNRPPPPPEPPPPPPPRQNVLEAMTAVYAKLGGQHPLLSRLERMAAQDRKELARGLISAETGKSRAVALAILRDAHARQLEEIRDWYLQRYFELFPDSATRNG